MEEFVENSALIIALIIESAAVLVITGGLVMAVIRSVLRRVREGGWFSSYQDLRKAIGRTLLVGLDFLLAAEIVRSIMAGETLIAALTLGVVVLVRTFLSIAIEMEITGRWPWNSAHAPVSEPDRVATQPAETKTTPGDPGAG